MINGDEKHVRMIKPLTVPLSTFLGFNHTEAEKERQAFRDKYKAKFVDSKWLKSVGVMVKYN